MMVNIIDPMGVDVSTSPPTEVEDPEARAAISQLTGERQHILGRATQPIERCDHQRVPWF
jgi:hypothetical protein